MDERERARSLSSSPTPQMDQYNKDTPRRRKKKKKKRPKEDPIGKIVGVKKMALSELTQKIIGCVAGEQVTSESPWTYVSKEAVQDNLELHEESSEFLPVRLDIINFPRDQILIGYIPDETREFDEFYICVTEAATDAVNKIIDRQKRDQEERLYNQINRHIYEWRSQGTDAEVDEAIIKNSRPLLEVEVETKYPIFPNKVQFRLIKAEKRRDGYMELRCPEEASVNNIVRKRVDASVQVAPAFASTHAQTICTYPSNSATQYQYEVEETQELLEQYKERIIDYARENFEDLSDLLRVNGVINLYSNDFSALIRDPTSTMSRITAVDLSEYTTFMEVNICKGKMVSDIAWHPMWTGTVAISYVDVALNIFTEGPSKDDEVLKAVHGTNPVLLWSFVDGMKPKLILESPREVHRVSFSKFDPNILIGGCKNGQIIVWDIRNKLQTVEEFEVLSTAQQKYRNYMNSLMGWMKKIHDLSIVRPTAVSNLRYSHKSVVTGITWVHPLIEFTNIGNLMEIGEHREDHSLQFITSSDDGTIHIWDLLKKPTAAAGMFKQRRLRRLEKRPSALTVHMSPYKILHLNLKPLYRINVYKPNSKNKPFPLTKVGSHYCHLRYEEVDPDPNRKYNITDRIIYKPIIERSTEPIKSQMSVCNMEGDYALIKWDGQDFDSGEVVNSEACSFLNYAKYHDGPIMSLHVNDLNKSVLTVGGKVFAIWSEDFHNRPILWRKGKHMYTKGVWSNFQPYKIILHSVSGMTEKYILCINSKDPIYSRFTSSNYVSASAAHPIKLKRNIYGVGDAQGAFRTFIIPQESTVFDSDVGKAFCDFIDREINRKTSFLEWQADWNERYGAGQRQVHEKEEKDEEEKEKPDEKPLRKGPQPGKYIEWIKEQRQLKEEARIKAMIISKKQLDTKELEKRRKPLQKLDMENERKKRKQKQRLKEGEMIFQDTVATLFPDVVKEKPVPPPDPYAGGDPSEEIEKCFAAYEELTDRSIEYIVRNPYIYEFDWKKVLIAGRERRTCLDEGQFSVHKNRRAAMKKIVTLENYDEDRYRRDTEGTSILTQEEESDYEGAEDQEPIEGDQNEE